MLRESKEMIFTPSLISGHPQIFVARMLELRYLSECGVLHVQAYFSVKSERESALCINIHTHPTFGC
jgi:hypothetical protein